MRGAKTRDHGNTYNRYNEDEWIALSKRIRRVEVLNIFFIAILILPKVIWNWNLHVMDDNFIRLLRKGDDITMSIYGEIEQSSDGNISKNAVLNPLRIIELKKIPYNKSNKHQTHRSEYITDLETKNKFNQSVEGETKEIIVIENSFPHWKLRKKGCNTFGHGYNLDGGDDKESKILQQTPSRSKSAEKNIDTDYNTKHDNSDDIFRRKMQYRRIKAVCGDKHIFRVDLQLDQYPNETSWELKDESTGVLVGSQKFITSDLEIDDSVVYDSNRILKVEPFSAYYFELCVEPGAYMFSLYDYLYDGIDCGDQSGCHKIFLNNEILFSGYPFTGNKIVHSFDLSSGCIYGSTSIQKLPRNRSDPEIAWKLLNEQFEKKKDDFQELVSIVEGSVANSTCVSSGLYSFPIYNIFHDEMVCGSTARPCPESNVRHFQYFKQYVLRDIITGAYISNSIGDAPSENANICLSPFGCYDVEYNTDNKNNGLIFDLNYSNEMSSLSRRGECDAVVICEVDIDKNSPKRVGLNHLTQLIAPTKGNKQAFDDALCWIMTTDTMFWDYSICDGTLLQRFVLAFFYFSQGISPNEVLQLGSNYTCDWPGITCDLEEIFVMNIQLSNKNLQGLLITEIGLLTSLKEINLSNNAMVGTIYPSVYNNLPNLEVFNVGTNEFGGSIPVGVLMHQQLKEFNISNNKFFGTLSSSVTYSESLEILDMGGNFLRGTLPEEIFSSLKLKVIDGSRNNFIGYIPYNIGKLANLRILKLNENSFSGIIPVEVFDCTMIEHLMLQSNWLTGSIPVEVSNLENVTIFSLSHNKLRGTIPTEFEKLRSLELLHFHQNQLTGIAPVITFAKKASDNTFISDCGDPSFKLSAPLQCERCTMCCNSEFRCQKTKLDMLPLWGLATAVFLVPIILIIIFYFANLKSTRNSCWQILVDNREPLSVVNEESIYCFLISRDISALLIFAFCSGIQVFVFCVYLKASIFQIDNTDWLFYYQCLNNSMECIIDNSSNATGWVPFGIITLLYLGHDFSISLLQIRKGVNIKDMELIISGCFIFCLSAMALATSYRYNTALAEKNTDLITNVLILLFINELDEKMIGVLESMFPDWTEGIRDKVKRNILRKVINDNLPLSTSRCPTLHHFPLESIFSDRQIVELELLHVPSDPSHFIIKS